MNRRIGKFTLSREVVMGPQAVDVFKVMRFVPLRAESLDYSNVYVYIGLSPLFDEVEDYMVVPEYEVMITHDPLKGSLAAAERV